MLGAHPHVTVHDKGVDMCGIVTFSVEGTHAQRVCSVLASEGINTSVTAVESSQYDFPRRGLDEVVRASPHYYNTEAELGRLVEIVSALT